MAKTWFITGASRGFGNALARAALADGDRVIATARRPESVRSSLGGSDEAVLVLPLDVTDEAQARDAVAVGLERFGQIGVLVNNAGYGVFGSIEEVDDAAVRDLFATNVFGLLNVTRAALPAMRGRRAGRIINVSSSAGFATGAGRGIYGASKFAVEGISEALRAEVGPLGIAVTVLEPGSFRTEFLSGRSRGEARVAIDDYVATVGALQTAIESSDGRQPGDPDKAVAAILGLARAEDPPARLQLGSDSVALVEAKLRSVADELELWRSVSLSTDF